MLMNSNGIASNGGISRNSFSEIINHRGLEQLEYVFQALCSQAKNVLPSKNSDLGKLISIDGSLMDAVIFMYWAVYRKGAKNTVRLVGYKIVSVDRLL